MRKRSYWIVSVVLVAAVALFVGVSHGKAQDRGQGRGEAPPPPPLVNIQVMKGMTRPEIVAEMQKIRTQLGVACTFCHVQTNGQNDFASEAKPEKLIARQMLRMVQVINEQEFFKNGDRKVECYTCHREANKIPIAPPPPPPAQGGAGRGAPPTQ